jgi:toxin CptA
MKSAPTIAFDYQPSRWIAGALALMTLAAAVSPWTSALSPNAALPLTILVFALGGAAMRTFWRPPSVRIAFRESGWSLVGRAGGEREAVLESHARLGPWVSLAFRDGAASGFRVLLGPDNLDAPTLRRLILLLSRAEILQKA